MQDKLIKVAKSNNQFLKKFIKRKKKTDLIPAMNYGLFSGGKGEGIEMNAESSKEIPRVSQNPW